MNKSFIIENAIKTAITAFILLACWAMVSQTFAAEGPGDDRRAKYEQRMLDRMEERMSKVDKDLSVDQVRDIVEGRLASMGNTNLKVGDVAETSDDTVLVDIVTQDDSLVQTVEVSTRTGRPAGAERHFARMMSERKGFRGPGRGQRGDFARGPGRQMRGGDFSSLALAMGPRNRDLDLTVEQARTLAESRLILAGNDRLKVGAVEAIDEETIVVEILTVDDSLVVRREIDRDTGRIERN